MRQFISDLVREAGGIIQSSRRTVTRVKTADNNVVTEADERSHAYITDVIRRTYPEHVILSEEGDITHTAWKTASHVWFVDPLDGTTAFSFGIPQYSVTIAYYQDGQPRVAATYDPSHSDLYVAERGKGAFLNGKRIRVMEPESLARSCVSMGTPYEHDHFRMVLTAIDRLHEQRSTVTSLPAALSAAYVACGRLSLYFEPELKPWDVAAGVLLVKEAGGVIATIDGEPFSIFDFETFIAGSPMITQRFIKLME